MQKAIYFFFALCFFSKLSLAQEDRKSTEINDIEIWTKESKVSVKGDTAIVQLYIQSYLKNPREFKLNTFGSGLTIDGDKPLLYQSITMGKVSVGLKDRLNYLNYLLTRDEPIVLTIKTLNWKSQWGKPKQLKLTFEDHQEEGKFLEYFIDL